MSSSNSGTGSSSSSSKDEQKEEVAVDKTNSDKRESNDKTGTTATSFDRKKEDLKLNTEAAGGGHSVAYASETPLGSGNSTGKVLASGFFVNDKIRVGPIEECKKKDRMYSSKPRRCKQSENENKQRKLDPSYYSRSLARKKKNNEMLVKQRAFIITNTNSFFILTFTTFAFLSS
jgi:hypothetical protein